jgi:hypothetical protein
MGLPKDTIEACIRLVKCSNGAQSRIQKSFKGGFHRAPMRLSWGNSGASIRLQYCSNGAQMEVPQNTIDACMRLERCLNGAQSRL